MPGFHNFRTAIGGFNRQDVVQYIEYMNNTHNAKVEQLNTQLQTLRAELEKSNGAANSDLHAQLEQALARCAELEAQLAQNAAGNAQPTDSELEAYRRAERTERLARERAAQIHAQANAALADATLKVDSAAQQIGGVADQLIVQLENYQATVNAGKEVLQDAVAAMYAIRPEE